MSAKEKKEIQGYIKEKCDDYLFEEQKNCMRRIYKLIAVHLNDEYGFGKKRIERLFKACGEDALELQQEDEVFWYHVDDFVINQLGLGFEREDYDKMDR
jgi:hypothetical protein